MILGGKKMNHQTVSNVILTIICLGVLLIFTPFLTGEIKPGKDWVYFHGPKGDNKSKETGLLEQWPENGPALLWTASGLGKGYSSVVVADQMIYTAGSLKDRTYVFALDYQGKIKWKKPNGKRWEAGNTPWARDYDGSRGTPTISDGLVYHLSELGTLTAFKANNGEQVWSINLVEKFAGQVPRYGYSESLLIDGNNLLCCPGGSKGYMVALDKKTGMTKWANKDIKEEPGYNSPLLVKDHGLRQVLTMTTLGVIGVNADTGELLWKKGHTNKRELNIANPVYQDGHVCISS
jgi:outer membrane protein assembly factor BamB